MVSLIVTATVLAPFALVAWFHKKLRDALAERHAGTLHIIDSSTRFLPRGRRAVERRLHYERLKDPEIDRHLRNLDRVQIPLQYAFIGLFIVLAVAFLITLLLKASRS